ncbi:flagellar motor protein MotB [Barrientosiimonas marina]|uniref:Flagellar motor protein MotB n=1 Tax=Lentibacillus kimchii TaxID=1542911 RepID=A0ABW2UV27_9BACI
MRRKKQRKSNHINESWLLPYSDLLTLLVALFIVLFAMSEVDAQKYQSLMDVFESEFKGGTGVMEGGSGEQEPLPASSDSADEKDKKSAGMKEAERLEKVQKKINGYIEDNNLQDVLGTELSSEGLLVTISNEVTFASGSAEVNAKGQDIAKEVSHFLYTDPPHQIVVSGHTDNRPINTKKYKSNWELSAMRAINFMRLILENEDLDPERFSSKGRGEYQPLVPNTNEENMSKNRRVEVLILPNHDIPEDAEAIKKTEKE